MTTTKEQKQHADNKAFKVTYDMYHKELSNLCHQFIPKEIWPVFFKLLDGYNAMGILLEKTIEVKTK